MQPINMKQYQVNNQYYISHQDANTFKKWKSKKNKIKNEKNILRYIEVLLKLVMSYKNKKNNVFQQKKLSI